MKIFNHESPFANPEFVNHPAALEKANKFIDAYRINMDDFPHEDRENDKMHVKKLQEKYLAQETPETKILKEKADILEVIIMEQAEMSEWFGEGASTVVTSKYDDFVNKIDGVVEYDRDGAVATLGLGIDVTYGHDLTKKKQGILDSIQKGEMGKIKYFESELSAYKGEMEEIPRLIVGADIKTVNALTNVWVGDHSNKVLAEHSVQFQILHEMIIQCEYFATYANTVDQEKAARRYRRAGTLLQDVYNEKYGSSDAPDQTDDFYADFRYQFSMADFDI